MDVTGLIEAINHIAKTYEVAKPTNALAISRIHAWGAVCLRRLYLQ
jgi:hypothetical protein